MNILKLGAAVATCAFVSMSYGATASLTSATAPDAVSKGILKTSYVSFQDGAAGPSDVKAAIDRNFANVIEHNLAAMPAGVMQGWLDQLNSRELSDLAQLYVNSNAKTVRSGQVLKVFAARLDAPHLSRLAKYFGTNEVSAAVLTVAPAKFNALAANSATVFAAPLAGAALVGHSSVSMASMGGVATPMQITPTVDWTLNQIYLNFRTLPVGSLSAQSAFYETAAYAGKNLAVAWGTGYAFGTGITLVMETYAPNFYYGSFVDVVGGTQSAAVNWVQGLVTTTYNLFSTNQSSQLGRYQASTIPTMGASSASSAMASSGGDLKMEYEYDVFMSGGGSKPCIGGTCFPIEAN